MTLTERLIDISLRLHDLHQPWQVVREVPKKLRRIEFELQDIIAQVRKLESSEDPSKKPAVGDDIIPVEHGSIVVNYDANGKTYREITWPHKSRGNRNA